MGISNATYGRSQQGLAKVKQNLTSDCSKMANALTGAEFNKLISTIQQYWSGVDATDWINDLKSMVKSAQNEVSKVSKNAQGMLDTDFHNFKSFQTKNKTK